jgi:integrative and conjugative element protein (TIGR02256 family)
MKLLLPVNIAERLIKVLKRRSVIEVGGILMGEHVSKDTFRIVDFTIQSTNNSRASFLRLPGIHNKKLDAFFRKTGENYTRYNYLGEWHSHPKFTVYPSDLDVSAMTNIVNSESVSANFAILLIVKLSSHHILDAGSWLFTPRNNYVHRIPLDLESESSSYMCDSDSSLPGFFAFGRRLFCKLRQRSVILRPQSIRLKETPAPGAAVEDP